MNVGEQIQLKSASRKHESRWFFMLRDRRWLIDCVKYRFLLLLINLYEHKYQHRKTYEKSHWYFNKIGTLFLSSVFAIKKYLHWFSLAHINNKLEMRNNKDAAMLKWSHFLMPRAANNNNIVYFCDTTNEVFCCGSSTTVLSAAVQRFCLLQVYTQIQSIICSISFLYLLLICLCAWTKFNL